MTAPAAASVDATGASFTGAIASPHALATEAGLNAYRDGGTAIDAAIAAAAVLTVVYPHNVALGGDLIALVREPNGAVHCINSSGWAARDIDAATYAGGKHCAAMDLDSPGLTRWQLPRTPRRRVCRSPLP